MIEDASGAFARSESFLGAGNENDAGHRKEMFLQSPRQQVRAYGIDPSSIRMQVGDDDGGNGGTIGQDLGAAPEPAPPPAATIAGDSTLSQDGPHEEPPYQTRAISGKEERLSSVAYGGPVKDMPGDRFLVRRKAAPAWRRLCTGSCFLGRGCGRDAAPMA